MRILGIDASVRCTGVGVAEDRGNTIVPVACGCIRAPRNAPLSECLKRLHVGIGEVIVRHHPDAAAVEGIFFCKNVKTAVALGQARGTAIAACAAAGIPVYEYPARRVKQAVVGYGSAAKEQVVKMTMAVLGLKEQPSEDEADALALAICHLHNSSGPLRVVGKPI